VQIASHRSQRVGSAMFRNVLSTVSGATGATGQPALQAVEIKT